MTLRQVSTDTRWICNNSDTKPTTTTHPYLDVGAECYEKDTGDNWIWDGVEWIEDIKLIRAIQLASS